MNFLKQLSAKYKLYALFGGLLLLALIAYRFSIKNTLNVYAAWQQKKQTLQEATNAPQLIQQYEQELNQFDKDSKQLGYDRKVLFEVINTYCRSNRLNIKDFHTIGRNVQGKYEVITDYIQVLGGYHKMVGLAYHLEQTEQLGHIASSSFELKKDQISRKDQLIGTLHLQNVQLVSE